MVVTLSGRKWWALLGTHFLRESALCPACAQPGTLPCLYSWSSTRRINTQIMAMQCEKGRNTSTSETRVKRTWASEHTWVSLELHWLGHPLHEAHPTSPREDGGLTLGPQHPQHDPGSPTSKATPCFWSETTPQVPRPRGPCVLDHASLMFLFLAQGLASEHI